MNLYLYSGRLDLACTTLADLRLLIAALADEADPVNAATIALVTGKIPPLVQSDTAEPLTLYSYDDATTLSSWITDAAVTVTLALGLPYAANGGAYTTADAAISGSSRTASLVLNTAALASALSGLRPGRGTTLWLHIRQSPAAGGETVALLPLTVLPGVISSPTNEDNAADISAAATSAAAALASQQAAASSAANALISEQAAAASETATGLDAIQTAADRVQTTADAAATAADKIACDSDAAATASDRSASATSAAAALASATAAALTASGAYKGGVAGASVPATSTLAGDYYRITAVGTSQSKTWAVGDMAIYNGTSGSWTQLAGILPYATTAEALAGTDTTKALTPSTGNERALLGDMTRRIADSLYSDGANSNRRVEWTPGAPGNVAGMGVHFGGRYFVPTSNASVHGMPVVLTSSATTPNIVANNFAVYLLATGGFRVQQAGANYTTDFRYLDYPAFRSTYSGRWVTWAVDFDAGDTTTNPRITINGVDITASFALTTGGTAPNWMPLTLDCTKFLGGYNWPAGEFEPAQYGPGAWTQAENLTYAQTGIKPPWWEVGTGSAVAQTSGALTIGWKYRISAYVASDVFTNVGAASNATGVEFVATGTTPTTWTNSSSLLKLGPIIKPVIDPNFGLRDLGANGIHGIRTAGISYLGDKTDSLAVFKVAHSGSGNLQFAGGTAIDTTKGWVIDSLIVRSTAAVTWSLGNVSAGAQYVSAYSLAIGDNYIPVASIVTRLISGANLWSNSNGAADITIFAHLKRTL